MKIRVLQDYLARQAQRRPEATAVVLGEEAIDYGELESRSNRLARLLKEAGCRRGDRVGLALPKSPTAVVAMLATLKADCCYVPVDPESPAARVQRILSAADCRCVMASEQALPVMGHLASGVEPWMIWMDRGPPPPDAAIAPRFVRADVDIFSSEPLPYSSGDNAPAHILFTSGSTGVPKGVVVGHANVIAFVEWANAYFGVDGSDRVSCHSPLHFDLSTYDLYGAFEAGAEVHLVPPEINLFPGRLVDFIRSRRLTQWFSVPSILVYLARFDAITPGDFPHLKRILWCGEVFPTPGLKYWMEHLPHVTFTNLYGPTEATIASSYYTVPAPPADANGSVPIGEACGGEELLVLGDNLQQLPLNQVGEIYIGGAGVTLGYWRDEEKTNRAFVRAGGGRIYRTGDLGYRGEDGLVRFLGRADSQIKSRGHRIELGEIEAALYALPEVAQGAVVAVEAPDFGGHVICCAYVPRADIEGPPRAIKEGMTALIPKYMLPARWRRMEALPANANGKIDRVALADMFRTEVSSSGGHSAGDHQ